MFPWSIHHFIKECNSSELSLNSKTYLLKQLQLVGQYGLRNVFTLRDLAYQTRTRYRYIRAIVGRKIKCYNVHQIRKKTSGYRNINVPYDELAKIQKWLAVHILSKINIHHCAYAYRKKYSIKDCATQHCCARWIISMDIKDFFENIYENKIYKIFINHGYNPLISFEMARLCTFVDCMAEKSDIIEEERQNDKYLIKHYNYLIQGHLPQGASTSPLLSNIVMKDIDEEIYSYCISHHIVYTRYSDDLIFSSSEPDFCRKDISLLKNTIKHILAKNGFLLNNEKFHVQSPRSRKSVLGLLVDTSKPRVTKQFREKVFQLLKSASIDFISSYKKYKRSNPRYKYISKDNFKKKVVGYMNYLHDVDFKRWEKLVNLYHEIKM